MLKIPDSACPDVGLKLAPLSEASKNKRKYDELLEKYVDLAEKYANLTSKYLELNEAKQHG